MNRRQRLRRATVPLPLLTPQAPGQLSAFGEPVPGPGGTMYAAPRVCECCGYAAVVGYLCRPCRESRDGPCLPDRPRCGEPSFHNPEGADDTNSWSLGADRR